MYLILSQSSVTVTEPDAFAGLDNLISLDLSGNNLQTLPVNFPKNLQRLDLHTNQPLGELPSKAFANLTKLRELFLYYTGLHQIDSDAFIGLSNLETLDLGLNVKLGGTNIPGKALRCLVNLKTLILSKNKMTAIKTKDPLFSGLQSLNLLDLSDNDCSQIPSDIFTGLGNLSTLRLQGNRLGANASNLNAQLFASLANLSSLDLANNEIETLPAPLFKGLKSLRNMSLSHNLITEWPPGATEFIANMTYLDLSDNRMSTIKVQAFSAFGAGFSLSLTGNPFDCWCDLRDFRRWINNSASGITLVNLSHYECNSPESMAGQHTWRQKSCEKLFFFLSSKCKKQHRSHSVFTQNIGVLIFLRRTDWMATPSDLVCSQVSLCCPLTRMPSLRNVRLFHGRQSWRALWEGLLDSPSSLPCLFTGTCNKHTQRNWT